MSFLKAEWNKLAFANYIIDRDVLSKYVPAGTELDLWDGKCFISLVGFMFKNTKLLGVKVPYHINFEEVNLRFYVKRYENGEWKRGVVFIKEIVPKIAITLVANIIYKENYETMPMKHSWTTENDKRTIQYQLKKGEKWHTINLEASIENQKIMTGSETEFITEHYWGYAKKNEFKTNEYEVKHPKWNIYEVKNYLIDLDFSAIYGKEFEFLNNQKPASVMLAEGSKISIEFKKSINKNL